MTHLTFHSVCLELPPIDGDRHLLVRLLDVPGFAVVFMALDTHPVEALLWIANKVCAVVQFLLARAAQPKVGDVALALTAFFVLVRIAPFNMGTGMIPLNATLLFHR